MSNNKGLPKEVVEKIREITIKKIEEEDDSKEYKGISFVNMIIHIMDGARLAQSHYEPIISEKDTIISELKQGYEPLNNQLRNALKDVGDLQEYLQKTNQGKLGSSVCKEAAKLLQEKDAKIDKLMGLLESEVKYHRMSYRASNGLVNDQERYWQYYKQEHGL